MDKSIEIVIVIIVTLIIGAALVFTVLGNVERTGESSERISNTSDDVITQQSCSLKCTSCRALHPSNDDAYEACVSDAGCDGQC